MAATCLKPVLRGLDEDASLDEIVKLETGLVLIADGLNDLRIIRMALTKKG